MTAACANFSSGSDFTVVIVVILPANFTTTQNRIKWKSERYARVSREFTLTSTKLTESSKRDQEVGCDQR